MPNTDFPEPRQLAEQHGLIAKKRYGQHFLFDRNILQKIVRAAAIPEGAQIIEVGPGPGALTVELLRSDAAHVTAIEIDAQFYPALEEIAAAAQGKLTVLRQDALKVALTEVFAASSNSEVNCIVANLPYNVAAPLLVGWLKEIHTDLTVLHSLTFMVQREFAERLVATPCTKDYGRLSVLTQWLCEASILFDVPPGAFSPPPKVESSVIQLVPRKVPIFAAAFTDVESFLAAAFGQRRKMLRQSLKNWQTNATERLERVGIDPTRRAETLTVEEVGKFFAKCTNGDGQKSGE